MQWKMKPLCYLSNRTVKVEDECGFQKNRKRPQQASAKMTARKTMVIIAYTANKRFSVKALPYGSCLDSDLYIDFLKSTGKKWRTLRADPIKLSCLS